jgi:hypothetical protein
LRFIRILARSGCSPVRIRRKSSLDIASGIRRLYARPGDADDSLRTPPMGS